MFERNNGVGQDNLLQNQFTAYLVKAIRNTKMQYLDKRVKIIQHEHSLNLLQLFAEAQEEPDLLDGLPVIDQIENTALHKLLMTQKKRDLYIFYARVLENRSFTDISRELNLHYKTVTQCYYRMMEKLKLRLRGEEE